MKTRISMYSSIRLTKLGKKDKEEHQENNEDFLIKSFKNIKRTLVIRGWLLPLESSQMGIKKHFQILLKL
jgi:hypothetical protein